MSTTKRKVFVSYKYSDSQVQDLDVYEPVTYPPNSPHTVRVPTTARHYVDKLTEVLEDDGQIYKGEDDDESMESLADSTIASKLGDKIFDSSVTIVLVSKGMKDPTLPEKEQWIPWEISYSLKIQTRANHHRSKANGVIALVLPDENGSYEYYITHDNDCGCTNFNTPFLFELLSANMFNVLEPTRRECNGKWVYSGDHSYIQSVKWEDFVENSSSASKYIDKAIELRNKREEFDIRKKLN